MFVAYYALVTYEFSQRKREKTVCFSCFATHNLAILVLKLYVNISCHPISQRCYRLSYLSAFIVLVLHSIWNKIKLKYYYIVYVIFLKVIYGRMWYSYSGHGVMTADAPANDLPSGIALSPSLIPGRGGAPPQSVPGSSRGAAGRLWRCLLARCPSWRDHEADTGTPDARPSRRRRGSADRWPSPGARYGEGKLLPVGNDLCVPVPPSRTSLGQSRCKKVVASRMLCS